MSGPCRDLPGPAPQLYTVQSVEVVDGDTKIIWTADSPPNRFLAYRFHIRMASGAEFRIFSQDDSGHSVLVEYAEAVAPGDTAEFV